MLVLTPFLQRPLQKLLVSLKLPRREAFDCAADKRGRGGIAQLGQIIGELSQLCEGIQGAVGPPGPLVLPLTLSRHEKERRGNAKGFTHPTAPRRCRSGV
jgi:hypothetical protein